MSAPLTGVTVLEFEGLGPAPFAAMCLADLGARVRRITRPGSAAQSPIDRDREDVALDLKSPAGVEAARALIAGADILIEGFRPGKMEQLGLGPDAAHAINPRLVYGRMTGWGQTGPMAHLAGHDLNYLGLTGLLSMMGEPGRPPAPPLNLVADYGGGGMYLALGVVSALLAARASGQGAVVDATMIHGASHLATLFHGMANGGRWQPARQANLLDGGAPFYRTYETADGRYLAVGSIEPQFWRNALAVFGLPEMLDAQMERAEWPAQARRLAARIAEKTLDAWVAAFDGVDACVTPVLTLSEAKDHPQMAQFFRSTDQGRMPLPAPLFTPPQGF
ncbi:CaiB/BaiF CoA transferase family protein [Pararhodobacter aggregans]|uniref:Carnitine dehydratase n=1 Tax=Pararhodobacter aggregans TaxID=404875 RepID=A0A2T7UUI1_9RHOB|nr:CaiB/BaiF CoA-transferase family protein [Pararhodobacter aggregans]PTX03038.1 alpha-methylacyl-CoA racemase [Pararhodobacter aggregans]PVE48238.1 carnitine dehydratase [Pararhodobacter aggregans]